MTLILMGRNIVIGYNAEPTLRFGIKRERMGRGGFVAVGLWPFLIGYSSRTAYGERWS